MSHSRYIGIGVLVTALTLAACGGATRVRPDSAPRTSPDLVELEELYRARTDSARQRFTGADVRFMTDMINHHAQAIVMARLAPERSGNAAVRTLASRIINSQQDEIANMQQWLRDRDQLVPDVHEDGTVHQTHGSVHSHMPGMLGPAQLEELERARGARFDRLFLTCMIAHHRGAVAMVHELLGTDGAAQDAAIFRLASDVQVDQITEIARMEQMLSALPPE